MSIPVFADIDKQVTDLFNDDFDLKHNIKIKSDGPCKSAITTNTQFDFSKDFKLVSKISSKWAGPNGFTLEKFEVAQTGNVTVETSLSGLINNVKLEYKGSDKDKGNGDLIAKYNHQQATITTQLDVLHLESAKLTATTTQGAITAGAAANFNIKKTALDCVGAAVAYTGPNYFAALRACKFFSVFTGKLSFVATPTLTLAATASHGNAKLEGALLAAYKATPDTTIKVKVGSCGTINASVKKNLCGKFSVIGAAEHSADLKGFKFGINANLG